MIKQRIDIEGGVMTNFQMNDKFKVSSYEPSAMKVELVKNDQFFGASDVKLDGVEFSIITDSQTAALSFENGDQSSSPASSPPTCCFLS